MLQVLETKAVGWWLSEKLCTQHKRREASITCELKATGVSGPVTIAASLAARGNPIYIDLNRGRDEAARRMAARRRTSAPTETKRSQKSGNPATDASSAAVLFRETFSPPVYNDGEIADSLGVKDCVLLDVNPSSEGRASITFMYGSIGMQNYSSNNPMNLQFKIVELSEDGASLVHCSDQWAHSSPVATRTKPRTHETAQFREVCFGQDGQKISSKPMIRRQMSSLSLLEKDLLQGSRTPTHKRSLSFDAAAPIKQHSKRLRISVDAELAPYLDLSSSSSSSAAAVSPLPQSSTSVEHSIVESLISPAQTGVSWWVGQQPSESIESMEQHQDGPKLQRMFSANTQLTLNMLALPADISSVFSS